MQYLYFIYLIKELSSEISIHSFSDFINTLSIFLTSPLIWFLILMFVGVNWQVFKKCGEKPWKAWIPFYSNYTLNKLIIGNGWFFILSYIPFVNVIYSLYLGYRIALAFKFKTMGTILAIGFSSLTLFAVAFSDTSKYTAVQQFKLKDFKNNLIPKKIDDYFN